MADDYPDRPWGWGICGCGDDCEDEADYDEVRQVSMCPDCRALQAQSLDEHAEVFVRR